MKTNSQFPALFALAVLILQGVNVQQIKATGSQVVHSYQLDVSFFPGESRMEGRAVITMADNDSLPTELIFFLHGELRVDSTLAGGRVLTTNQEKVFYEDNYSLIATRIAVAMNEKEFDGNLVVYYSGYFHPSKTRSASDYMRIDQGGAYLRAYGYSLWFPVFLESGAEIPTVSFSRVTLRTPQDYSAVFVGEHLSERISGASRISEWKAIEIPIFAAQCTVQKFTVFREGAFWIYSWQDEQSQNIAPEIALLAERLNDLYQDNYRANVAGNQIHVVEMPRYGDISSGNVIGLSYNTWSDFAEDEYAKRTLAHEFVHPFVSVPVVPGDPIGAMVIEGFPSYFHLPVLAEIVGEEYYDEYLDRVQRLYIEKKATKRGRRGWPLPPEKALIQLKVEEIGIYKDQFILSDRVLLLFDYLRRNMGREPFFRFAQDLLNQELLDVETFHQIVVTHLPGASDDLRLWLETTDYPNAFHRKMKP